MEFVSWNIQFGGQSRADSIVAQLRKWNPDVVGLSEVCGSEPSKQIANALSDMGLVHQVDTVDSENPNQIRLLLASRQPFEVQSHGGYLHDSGRWIHARMENELNVILMHVPNRGTPIADCTKKVFHDEALAAMKQLKDSSAVAFGDTNSGMPVVDEENEFFNDRESVWLNQLHDSGWTDVWRRRNPDAREYTWYSNHGNGFRLDQAFATQQLEPKISSIRYDWGEGGREAKLSDHAAIVFELDT